MTGGGPYREHGGPSANGPRCPRCRRPTLRADRFARLAALRCLDCRGAWLDLDAFAELAVDPVLARGVFDAAPDAPIHYVAGTALCPVCSEPMHSRFHRGAGQVLDRCARHGVWFDPGELRAAADRLSVLPMELPEVHGRVESPRAPPAGAPPERASLVDTDARDGAMAALIALLDLFD